jgi:hypothetical protein
MDNEEPVKVNFYQDYIREHPNFSGCLINKYRTKFWFLNGQKHREKGPAIIYCDGIGYWFLYGTEYEEKEHRVAVRLIKLKMLDTL